MGKARLEAFSDGVLAIIITIMVLELKVPHGTDLKAIKPLIPVFLSYVLSFVYVAIYWNNHHHLMHTVTAVNGKVLWANVHLLFWLSLMPATTGWMGENQFTRWPVVLYGIVLVMSALAYHILLRQLKQIHKDNLVLEDIVNDSKNILSAILYVSGIILAFVSPMISAVLYGTVALIWFIPHKKVEERR